MGAPVVGAAVMCGSAHAGSGSANLTVTFTIAHAAGGSLAIAAAWDGNATTTTIGPDSSGNVYLIGTEVPANQGRLNTYYCPNAAPVPIGGTVTLTLSKSGNNKMMAVHSLPAAPAFDQEAGSFGTGLKPLVTSGPLAQLSNEIALEATWENLGASDSGYIEDTNSTALFAVNQVGALRTAYRLLSAADPVSYSPTLGVSNNWAAKILLFRGVSPKRRIITRFRGPGIAIPPPSPVLIGYQASTKEVDDQIDPIWITQAHNIGARTFRIGDNNTTPTLATAITIRDQALAANLTLQINFKNRPKDDALKQSVPAADRTIYQAQIASQLDVYAPAIQPENGGVISIENECNGAGPGANFQTQGIVPAALIPGQAYGQLEAQCMTVAQATYDAYRNMLNAAVDVCHSTGAYIGQGRKYMIADCGISSTGFCRLRWLNLWEGGDYASADAYLALITEGGDFITGDLPNSVNPNRPIFANNPQALINLQISGLILNGAASSGIDYFNVHLFWSSPIIGAQIDAIKWARSVTGLPLVMTAVGQKSTDTPTSAAIGGVAASVRPHIFSIFGASNSSSSFPFADPVTGALNSRGVALKAVLDTIT